MVCNYCTRDSSTATCDSLRRRRRRSGADLRRFRYEELETATAGFSPDSLLGKGSHGSVYKALLDDGKLPAAVKLSSSPLDHDHDHPGDNELHILSAIRHPGLVNLIGFGTADGGEKRGTVIVVEFMPNGTLYEQLHCAARPPGWAARARMALQTARAVAALHASDPPVIHRDIKSSNVLIDARFDARLGDFGLALRGHAEDFRRRATPPAGTLGYLDPAYLTPDNLSTKSDVFSFGILLLEIVSGRHAIDVNYSPPSIVEWAAPLAASGEHEAVLDRRIGWPREGAAAGRMMVALAAECGAAAAEGRPAMEEVVRRLKGVARRRSPPPVWGGLERLVERLAVDGKKVHSNVPSSSSSSSDLCIQSNTTRKGLFCFHGRFQIQKFLISKNL